MKKWIKRIIVTVAVIVIGAAIALQAYMHYDKKKKSAVAGNSDAYNLEHLEKNEKSILTDKNIVFIGSSVTYGEASEAQSFVELFEYLDGVNVTKEAKSATTLVDKYSLPAFIAFGNGESYVKRLKKLDTTADVDCVVCQLSTNDATMKLELGAVSESDELSDFDTDTITGAMEYIIKYSIETWECPVVFYTGSYYESDEYKVMVERLYDLQKKWDIGIIDLYTDVEFNNIDEDTYHLYMYDKIHPTKAGYVEWWMPKMEADLKQILSE